MLSRWGHSSCVEGNSVYIFGGRNNEDFNELLCFEYEKDTEKYTLRKIETSEKPDGRRKGVLINIGSFLFLHGGFNSQYFSQIHLFNIFYSKKLKHKQNDKKIIVSRDMCDVHINTIDRKMISFSTPIIEHAFPSAEARI